MKLKYYLRGLGIGVIVTALLMGVALKDDRSLSDAEIRARAAALGMVEGEARTLADLQTLQGAGQSPPDTAAPTETPGETATPTATETPGETASPAPTETPGETVSSTPEAGSTAAPGDGELPKPLAMVTPKPAAASSPEPAGRLPRQTPTPTPEPPESVTLVIRSGQSSYGVSKSLVEAGLVEDASDFDRYLEDNGYSKRISTGTYEIPVNSTEEEIAKIITRSR